MKDKTNGLPTLAMVSAAALQELSDTALFLTDLDRKIISCNPGVERILGYTEGDFVGQQASILFTPEDLQDHVDKQEFDTARDQGRSPDVRWHMRKNGSQVFIDGSVTATRDSGGIHVGYSKVMRDLRPECLFGNLLKTFLDGTPDVIFATDKKGRYTFVNSQTARLLGRSIDDALGHSADEFFTADISGPLHENNKQVMANNKAVIIEERMGRKDSGICIYLSGKAPWHDSNGKILGVVTIAQDFSARKSAEQERERLVDELRRSNEELAQFSSVVAHDLQSPLRTVMSYTDLLARRYQGKLDATADEFMTFIRDGVSGMDELIRALLRYAQVGEEPIRKKPVALTAVLDGVLSNLRSLLETAQVEVTSSPLPSVTGDSVQLLQLFQNLISNAIKYGESGRRPVIRISVQKAPAEYRIAVADNGMGIKPQDLDRIFVPLKRLHGAEIPGSGIGLAICKKIVERHGGRISAESSKEGSTFYFTIPRSACLQELARRFLTDVKYFFQRPVGLYVTSRRGQVWALNQ